MLESNSRFAELKSLVGAPSGLDPRVPPHRFYRVLHIV